MSGHITRHPALTSAPETCHNFSEPGPRTGQNSAAKKGQPLEIALGMSIADIRPEEDRPRRLQTVAEREDALRHSGTWSHCRVCNNSGVTSPLL